GRRCVGIDGRRVVDRRGRVIGVDGRRVIDRRCIGVGRSGIVGVRGRPIVAVSTTTVPTASSCRCAAHRGHSEYEGGATDQYTSAHFASPLQPAAPICPEFG